MALTFPKHLWPCNYKFVRTLKHFILPLFLLWLWLFLCPCCTFAVSCLASSLHVVYCIFIALTEQKGLWSALLFSAWPTDTFGLCWIGLFRILVSLPHCSFLPLTFSVGRNMLIGATCLRMSSLCFFSVCVTQWAAVSCLFIVILSNCFSGRTA